MYRHLLMLLLALVALASAPAQAQGETLTLITHDSFNISESVQAEFEAETGIQLDVVRLADAGLMLNQVILSKGNPLGDVLFGIDNTLLSRALDEDLFIAYEAAGISAVPEAFVLDPEFRVTPVDFGDVCLNYDVAYFAENNVPIPDSLADLTEPDYDGLLVVPNPATSSPGLAFLLATIAAFGDVDDSTYDYLDYWEELVANDVLIVDGWTEAYYSHFTVPSEDGDRPLVVSYASSPPAEVYFADPMPETALTGAITADGTCFRQVEFAGILQGTEHLEAAQQWIDFMLSPAFQADLPLQMFVFPVLPEVALPPVFAEFAAIPQTPAQLPPQMIAENRERWIRAWVETVLR